MASQVHSTAIPQSKVSSSDDINTHEKISPVPSYDEQRNVGNIEATDVKYGTGVQEKVVDGSQSSMREENEGEGEERGFLSKIWHKYKPFFHAAFLMLMTG